MNKWLKYVFFPHWFILLLLVIISVCSLTYSFMDANALPIEQYASYTISAYTLIVVVIGIPSIYRNTKNALYSNKYSYRFITDKHFRSIVLLVSGFSINVIYAVLKLLAGLYYQSIWLSTIAIYYLVLSIMRFGLLIGFKKDNRKKGLKVYRFVGYCMFLLNIVVSGVVIQMIWHNESFYYPGYLIFANAAFAFYSITVAIINLFKYRKMVTPVLSAAKMLSFATALVSILTLQTAMLVEFAEVGQEKFIWLMNSFTGFGVCLILFVMAIWMVKKAGKELLAMEVVDGE